ncbi:MAG: LysR family transcriptional regulator, partial [Bdellovibrionales bacterium]|nr:LysR family transcriptional regulator [Bdellovibrionales bacterium]
MITNLETLAALSECGTMLKTASHLRISQSTVSKRIASLEQEVGHEVIERTGRHVKITNYGIQLLERSRPLLAQLKDLLSEEVATNTGQIALAVADSIIISWGAPVLSRVKKLLPGLNLELHIHDTFICMDRVRAGECMMAFCPGYCNVPDL